MPLTPGTRLGPYEILAKLGEGGMGEVYRARDTKLNRDVALKILPEAFASDPDRLARFTREAQTLAALSHTNIAHIHGFEESGAIRALVMELVEGDDLSVLIARGPVVLADALSIAGQIINALEAAHEAGIIHRDLKPANIKVRPDGVVKVLDFGLAKAMDPAGASGAAAMNSPTLTNRATEMGVILGTAAYMAPEQAKGRAVDKRADIWAFGVVLHEMLTGQRMFEGESVAETLGLIFAREPDLAALPPGTPASLRMLIARCLVRDPRQRLRDIGDARIALESAPASEDGPNVQGAVVEKMPARRWPWIAAMAGAAALSVIATIMISRPAAPGPVRLSIPLPTGMEYTIRPATPSNLAVSPDGSMVAFSAMPLGGAPDDSTLFLRKLSDAASTPVADSASGRLPFFSPDGQWVAFLAGSALKKASVNGGAPTTIVTGLSNIWGSVWLADGTIVYANPQPNGDMLFSVPSQGGGQPTRLSRVDRLNEDNSFPQALDNGDLIISMWTGGLYSDAKIARFSPATGKTTTMFVEGGSQPHLLKGGHLVYARGPELFATPFRSDGAQSGAVKVQDGVLTDLSYATAQFDVSPTGTLAYAPSSGATPSATVVWVSANGQTETVFEDPRIEFLQLSTDGRHVVFTSTQNNRDKDLWTYDLVARRRSRLTSSAGEEYNPTISRDGRIIIFSAWRETWGVHRTSIMGGAEQLVALPRDRAVRGWSISPDGRWLGVSDDVPGGADDRARSEIGILDLEAASSAPKWLTNTTFKEDQPIFSPAGRLLAFVSNQLGQPDVWVADISATSRWAPIPVSRDGGINPFWSADGRTLHFTKGTKLMAVTIGSGNSVTASEPREIMTLTNLAMIGVSGNRFLAVRRDRNPVTRIDLILNWSQELKRRQ